MKTISAVVKSPSGDSIYIYAGGETDKSGKLIGGIKVCSVSPHKEALYTKSFVDLIGISGQITQTLKDLRHKITMSSYLSEEAFKRDYDDRWNHELAMKRIGQLVEMKSLFSRILDLDDCFLQVIDC